MLLLLSCWWIDKTELTVLVKECLLFIPPFVLDTLVIEGLVGSLSCLSSKKMVAIQGVFALLGN